MAFESVRQSSSHCPFEHSSFCPVPKLLTTPMQKMNYFNERYSTIKMAAVFAETALKTRSGVA